MREPFDPLDNDSLGIGKTMMSLENSLGDMPTMRSDGKSIGRVDRYELIEKLGEGGFGAVYGARDTEAGILVALKALPAEISRDAEEMAQIRDNFALVSRLHHPNIASVLHLHRVMFVDAQARNALGVREDDYLVVMEYAPGATLFAWRRALPGRKLDLEMALPICQPIATALDYAHSQRILHRDIKPKNVMVAQCATEVRGNRQEGQGKTTSAQSLVPNAFSVKVLDFGLAAEIRSSMSRKSRNPQDSKSGTPFYMAPEQWKGVRQDGRADQYALAAMLYELISGEVPFKSAFDSGNFDIMRNAVCSESVPLLKELDRRQNAVLQRGLAKDPEARFGSCAEFVGALAGGRFLPQRAQRNTKGSKRAVVGLVVVGLLAGGYSAWKVGTDRRAARSHQEQLTVEQQNVGVTGDPARGLTGSEPDPASSEVPMDTQSVSDEGAPQSGQEQALLVVDQQAEAESMQQFRQIALTEKEHAEMMCRDARAYDASELAKSDWTRAIEAETRARQYFAVDGFEAAAGAWKEAAEKYERAAEVAKAMPEYRRVQTQWNDLVAALCDSNSGTKMLVTEEELLCYAPTAWADAGKLAQLGEKAAGDPVSGRQKYEAALEKYEDAVRAAEPYLVPRLTVSVVPSSAQIEVRKGAEVVVADAAGWRLVAGESYTLSVTGAGYRPHAETLVATWHGIHPVEIALEKSSLVPGKDIAIDLGAGQHLEFVWIPVLNGWCGKYEVTNGEYRRFKSDHNTQDYNGHSLAGNRQPAVQVSWEDAHKFIQWIQKNFKLPEGYRVKLPSKSEWITVAQCGDNRKYPWGNSWPPERGNYATSSDPAYVNLWAAQPYTDCYDVACNVEDSGKNEWGVFGIGGNAWEWTDEKEGKLYILKGASWNIINKLDLTINFRLRKAVSSSDRDTGFRVFLLQ